MREKEKSEECLECKWNKECVNVDKFKKGDCLQYGVKMKKLTLKETWNLCLSQWRWIAKEVRKSPKNNIDDLKEEWVGKYGFFDIDNNCFFCNYAEGNCDLCPARKVDKSFDCYTPEYNHKTMPIAFYNKLVSLNKKRLAKKRS